MERARAGPYASLITSNCEKGFKRIIKERRRNYYRRSILPTPSGRDHGGKTRPPHSPELPLLFWHGPDLVESGAYPCNARRKLSRQCPLASGDLGRLGRLDNGRGQPHVDSVLEETHQGPGKQELTACMFSNWRKLHRFDMPLPCDAGDEAQRLKR